jgi:hypothetical protein
MGLRDDILAMGKRPRKVKKVDGEPWGRDDVYVLKMSGVERDSYQMDIISRSDKQTGNVVNVLGWHANVVTMFACDKDGVKIFNKNDAKDLNETDPDSLDMVFGAVLEFNGLLREAQEDLEKNSVGETGDGSSADSPSNSTSLPFDTYLDGSPVKTLASG